MSQKKSGIFNTPLWRALLPLSFSVIVYGMNGAIYTTLATEQLGDNVYKAINIADSLSSFITFGVSGIVGELSQPSRMGRKRMILLLSVAEAIPIAALHLTKDFVLFLKIRVLMSFVGISRATEGLSIQPLMAAWVTDWATMQQQLTMYSLLAGGMFVFFALGPLISGALMHLGVATADHVLMSSLVVRALQPLAVMLIFPSDAKTREFALQQSNGQSAASTTGGSMQPNDNLRSVQYKAWWYLLTEHRDIVIVSLLLSGCGKAFLKNSPIFMAKELGLDTYEISYLVGVGCSASIVMQLSVVPLLNARCRPSPIIMLLASVVAQLLHLGTMAAAQGSWALWATIWMPGIIISADAVVQTVVAASGEEGGLSQGAKQGALSGMRTAAACFGPLIYTVVEAVPSLGARAAWISQGIILLPALFLLVWNLCFKSSENARTAWTGKYKA